MKKRVYLFAALIILVTAICAWAAQKTITTYTWDSDIGVQPVATSTLPPANIPVFTASFDAVLSALDRTGTGNKVASAVYSDSSGCSSIWAIFRNFTMVDDPDNTSCTFDSLIVPLSGAVTAPLRETWTTHGRVSYDIQVKVGWERGLLYAAQGVNIRWRESATPGKYEGYGISFINFDHKSNCSTSSKGDYLPIAIKPGPGNSLQKTLLLVLWKQTVVSGVERRNWLAYAVLGEPGNNLNKMNDPKVIGGQSSQDSPTITDNVTLVVRVEDTVVGSRRYSDIKIYYGDPSTVSSRTSGTRGFDTVATNINRGIYSAKCTSGNVFPRWPSNHMEAYTETNPNLTYWSYPIWYAATPYLSGNTVIPTNRFASDGNPHTYRCGNNGTSGNAQPLWPVASGATVNDAGVVWRESGTSRPTGYDYFSMLSTDPLVSNNNVRMVVNTDLVNIAPNFNEASTVILQQDQATIRTTDFALTDYLSGKPEIALHGMGDLTGSKIVAFNDLALQILGRRE